MKLTHTLRTCLVFAFLISTGVLISHVLAKSPTPAKASPTPKKVYPTPAKAAPPSCNRTIKVQVVALDQPWMWNRLGASQPGGMIYALARDVVKSADNKALDDLETLNKQGGLLPLCGKVRLCDEKRPRPLVLRANKGDCLEITFVNLLSPQPALAQTNAPAPTRWAGIHATGMELVGGINSDSSWVGTNQNSLAKNGELKTYKWYATEEGTFLIYSAADMDSQYQANQGLFGAIHVEPEGAEWYRSQITHRDLVQATLTRGDLKDYSRKLAPAEVAADPPIKVAEKAVAGEQAPPPAVKPPPGTEKFTKESLENYVADKRSSVTVYVDESHQTEQRIHSATGQPLIYYNAVYTDEGKPCLRGKHRVPVLQMLQVNEGESLYDQPLQKQDATAYINEVSDLDAGIIPTALRLLFKDAPKIKHELSAGARVVEQYRYSWLITDQGEAYYVLASPPTQAQAGRLQIFSAELELIYSDLTAVITGPNAGRFALSNTSPTFRQIPAAPDRRQPYREYTIIYHQAFFAAQAFAAFSNQNLINVIQSGADNFAINYGSGAIGPEIIANRLGVGPMGNKDAVDLKFEEFFLSAWSVGDPAMVVDCPANATNAIVDTPEKHQELHKEVPLGSVTQQANGTATPFPKRTLPPPANDFAPLPVPPMPATKAFFPDDPSNVYHSYMNDHVKFRILHAGGGPSHVHHLHAHQWLRSPDSDSSSYLDSQLIVPGSAFTLEITYNGSGNRNKTVGDSIFHCHFYPHFAQGMWALWRVHDVFEEGTLLDEKGVPLKGINRALPDGEIRVGTPIPAIVPLPTLGMAPMPAKVKLTDLSLSPEQNVPEWPWKSGDGQGRRVEVIPEGTGPDGKNIYKNPGYPFFIPGVAGHRPPHPPLDLAWLEDPATRLPILNEKKEKIHLDGGLPRHIVLDGKVLKEFHTRWDFSKDTALRGKDGKIVPGAGSLTAMQVPEDGTPVELAAMNEHAIRTRPTTEPTDGQPGNFILNGLPPTNGAPFADPGVNDQGSSNINRRRYQAAVFQVDTILNKKGWHYPQQRMISLWQDVAPTMDKTRPPEPFFFRTNTSDSIQFWHTNLLPSYYELDDFQVRTPTDIVGQHIHLVKFDVTSSDGAGNGFNYEDGTFAPDEVQERIDSINARGGLFALDPATGFVNMAKQDKLTLKNVGDYYPPPDSKFDGFGPNGVPKWIKPAGKPGSVFAPTSHAEAWDGAQTTIQLWDVDSLLNNEGEDRTLRTVFSHDHFGPSTHQQAGLYAGMVVEPEKSEWYLPHGERMNTRSDGGPTSWQGYIVTQNPTDSYREFMLEFQDMQLAYAKGSPGETSAKLFDPSTASPSAAFLIGQQYSSPVPLTTADLLLYAAALDQAKLPGPIPDKVPQPGFTGLFPQFGIPLSDKATVKVDQPGHEWTITEAANQINAGTKYVVRARRHEANGPIEGLLVFTPDITPGWASGPDGSSNAKFALNAPRNIDNGQQDDKENFGNGPPFAQIVSQNQFGTYSLNYRNEPVPFRVGLPSPSPSPLICPSPAPAADLALAYSSMTRIDPDLNIQPDGKTPGYPKIPLVPNAQPTDPYTPLLQAYVNDKVQIRTLVGAHTQAHPLQIHGVKWLFEPDNTNSGWRNAQLMGLSEHFEMIFELPGTAVPHPDVPDLLKELPAFADYFYSPSSGIVGLNNGLWGIIRAYGDKLPYSAKLKDGRPDPRWLEPLPNNPKPEGTGAEDQFKKGYDAHPSLRQPPDGQPPYDITAVTASVLPNGKLNYNKRAGLATDAAVLYVRTADLELKNGKWSLKDNVPIEPLILRASAGQWIKVTLRNGFALNDPGLLKSPPVPTDPALKTCQELPYGTPFGGLNLLSAQMLTSLKVGLHPQLVGFDPIKANGLLVGFNPTNSLVSPGPKPLDKTAPDPKPLELYWYAGDLRPNGKGFDAIPIEFGATNLTPADPLLQSQFGMVGALIIEPEGSTWVEDPKTYASATVTVPGGGEFREFVVVDQNIVANNTVKGIGAINYSSEPFSGRVLPPPQTNPNPPPAQIPAPQGYSAIFSNQSANPPGPPETPTFTAAAGTPVRFRLLIPGTETSNALNRPPVFMIHGHPWQEEPYIDDSTKIGFNPLSQTQGAQQAGVGQKFDIVLPSAGGQNKIAGDYLYTTYQTAINAGTWGLFRVTASKVTVEKAVLEDGFAQASGLIEPATGGAALPKELRAWLATDAGERIELGTTSVAADGRWTLKVASSLSAPARIQVIAIEENGKDGAAATAAITGPPPAEKFATQSDKSSPALSP
jgi:hypothetical protein